MSPRSALHDPDNSLEDVRRHLRVLVDLARAGGKPESVAHFLDAAVIQVSRAVRIEHVKILEYRKRTSDFLIRAGIGWREGTVGVATLAAGTRSAPGRAFLTGDPVAIADYAQQTDFLQSELLREHGIASAADVPIMIDGRAWGVLEVDSTTACEFSQDTVDFLMAAGAFIGAVLRGFETDSSESMALADTARRAQQHETLLREVQHRVKNNFQLILSSVSIQKRRYNDPKVSRALDHVMGRIDAISIAHDQLAVGGVGHVVNVADYLRALSTSIKSQAENVEIDCVLDELKLTIERALPLGLIMNEAATNSVKHAFGGSGGKITVRLQAGLEFGQGRLTISDNGKGMGSDRSGGSGLKLMESLAAQTGGTVMIDSGARGTSISILFPVIS